MINNNTDNYKQGSKLKIIIIIYQNNILYLVEGYIGFIISNFDKYFSRIKILNLKYIKILIESFLSGAMSVPLLVIAS